MTLQRKHDSSLLQLRLISSILKSGKSKKWQTPLPSESAQMDMQTKLVKAVLALLYTDVADRLGSSFQTLALVQLAGVGIEFEALFQIHCVSLISVTPTGSS